MKTYLINVNAPVEYIMGHLRSGSYVGDIELTEEEYAEFKKDAKEFLYNHDILSNSNMEFEVDDYGIDDIGPVEEVNYTLLSERETN